MLSSNKPLSKSDYMLFLRHPAWLWLKKYDKDKLPAIDDNLQSLFDEGREFESYAEMLFPDATRLGFHNYDEYKNLPSETSKALGNGAKTILQGRFEVDGITCIVDVLGKASDDQYDLIEIKSSTRVKPEHEYDLAFQLQVLNRAGINIRNIAVIHANSEYVREGDINPEQICEKTDVTGAVHALADVTAMQIDAAMEVLKLDTCPDLSPRYANKFDVKSVKWFEEWLDIYKSLKPDLDPYSIYFLSYPTAEQIGKLEDNHIEFLKDVPDELCLRDKQSAQVKTTRENKRIIEPQKIKEFIDSFEYPLYFFDYETLASAIPDFEGGSPYKDYPFQYSLHILDSPDSEIRHVEYLHQDNSNPMPALLEKMRQDIGDSGTVLAWYVIYEKGCNDRMAEIYPEYKEFLKNINERMMDLMIPFSNMWFFDKDFYGSASIKKVLPVLCPDLSHKELEVSDGLYARRLWMDTFLRNKNQNREKIASDLCEYCTLDTYAMVRIFYELRKVTGQKY